MAGPPLPHLPGFCQLSPKGFFDPSSSPASCFSSQAFLLLRPGSRHLSSDSQNHCRDARLPLSLPPPLRSLSLPLLSSFSLEIQILISFLSSGEFRFLFPDFFFFSLFQVLPSLGDQTSVFMLTVSLALVFHSLNLNSWIAVSFQLPY